jgi:hypothetical protein
MTHLDVENEGWGLDHSGEKRFEVLDSKRSFHQADSESVAEVISAAFSSSSRPHLTNPDGFCFRDHASCDSGWICLPVFHTILSGLQAKTWSRSNGQKLE